MKYTKAVRVFMCCGKYYATTLKTGKCFCEICGKELTSSLTIPRIVIMTNK